MTKVFSASLSRICELTPPSFPNTGQPIHVWEMIADHLPCPDFLSEMEKKRHEKFSDEAMRSFFLQSRFFMKGILAHYCGIALEKVRIETEKSGKPFLVDFPDLHFSLTHTGETAFLAVARAPVGIDAEGLRRHPKAMEISRRFFHPNETRLLQSSDEAVREELFFSIWTAKEALVKAAGSGMWEGMNAIELGIGPNRSLYPVHLPFSGKWAVEKILRPEILLSLAYLI